MQQQSQLSSYQESQQWFTMKEAGKYLRVSRDTIKLYRKNGWLPYYILPSGRPRFKREDLDNLLTKVE